MTGNSVIKTSPYPLQRGTVCTYPPLEGAGGGENMFVIYRIETIQRNPNRVQNPVRVKTNERNFSHIRAFILSRFRAYILFIFYFCCLTSVAQQPLRNPFDFPILLSGNFGELRSNHFHSGIDFKTQGAEGKTIYAVADGYIYRIAVSPWGYGNALYLVHGDSIMTVYGHLQRFTDKVAAYVKAKQYERESFSVDLSLTPEDFPVKKGDIIGYSGNSGDSGGPHLHFEVRDLQTDEPVDPIPYYIDLIKDTRPPLFRALMVYPVENEGVVNGSQQKQRLYPVTSKEGKQTITGKLEAWGKIAFSVNIDDYMDGTTNVYGVKEMMMFVDSQKVFQSDLDRFAFNETRYLNAWVDFEEWKEKRSFYTKAFVEPGNRLRFMTSKNRGFITIDEPRTYHVEFQLTDAFGNTNRISVDVTGKEQPILPLDTTGTTPFYWHGDNRFGANGIRLFVPRGSLYNHVNFRYQTRTDARFLSDVHSLHNKPVALHQPALLSLRILADTLAEKRQYGIVSVTNNRMSWIGGYYRDSWLDANIRELGEFAVMYDSIPPRITSFEQTLWITKGVIAFRLTDNLSGVATYRGEIDGQYALFEMDGKKALIRYTLDRERLSRGEHSLVLTVNDACGNQTVYETKFKW